MQPTPPFRWEVATVLIGPAIISMTVIPLYVLTSDVSPWVWLMFAVLMMWNGMSITAGYHRLWSHKSYQAHPVIRFIFALGGALAIQNSILQWCSNHRHHHRDTDDINADPYSIRRGLFFAHVGWMLRDYPAAATDYANVRDLREDPIVAWQHRWYWTLVLFMNIGLVAFLGLLAGDVLGALLIAGVLRLALCHHCTFFINSLAHYWGRQPYSDANSSRDNPLIAVLTYGEGYHNFHHTFQWDYRNGHRWYHFDPTKWLIRVLSAIGLTGSLKRVSPVQVETAMAAMQLKQATDRIKRRQLMNTEEWINLLDTEYERLMTTLNEWSAARGEWLTVRTDNLLEKWERTHFRNQLREIESRLHAQRRQWRMLTAQFA